MAQRLTVYLPIAFGRRLFEGLVEISPKIVDGERERLLDDDPVWRAARERARRADRSEIDRIGLTGAEFRAVNRALLAGERPEDLVLSPVTLIEPLLPAEPGHGGVPSPLAAFRAFLDGHGFAVDDASTTRPGPRAKHSLGVRSGPWHRGSSGHACS